MSTELTVLPGGTDLAAPTVTREYLHERRELIRSQLSPGASDVEIELLIETAAARGLNPITRQIYGVMRWDSKERREKMAIQTGIDGFRLIAQRTGEYRGQVGPHWCGPDGQWREVWLEDGPPAAARVGVLRAGWSEPLWGVARWKSYVQTLKDGSPTRMWAQMSDVMLAKVAEALALRKAFPEDLSGLYTADEMAQADTPRSPAPAADPTAELIRSRVRELRGNMTGEAFAAVMQAAGISRDDLADDDVYARAREAVAQAVEDVAASDPAAGEVATVTQPQMAALHAAGAEHGLDHDALHQIAHDLFGVESMRDIPRDGMDQMLEAIDQAGAA